MSRTILCYGDSNTWGADPVSGERFAPDVRWPGVLRQELGAGFDVIEEGLPGRTTVWDDPIEGYKNGREYLIPCLASHCPVDLVIILLGTNDLKHRFALTAYDIAAGAGVLVDIVRASQAGPGLAAPLVLLIAPPPIGPLDDPLSMFSGMYQGAEATSRQLGYHYRQVATDRGCLFLDAATVVRSSPADGIHLDAPAHAALAKAIDALIRRALN